MWNFNKFKQSIAVIEPDGKEITYQELSEYCQELSRYIEPHSLIFNLCSNTLGSLVGYLSAIEHNNVPLMLDEHIDHKLLSNFCNLYHPRYLWANKKLPLNISGKEIFNKWGYSLIELTWPHYYPIYGKLALLLTTSGSMGSPKFVRLSYENILNNTESIIDYLKITSAERAITSLPMNYTFGLSVINSHLMQGAGIVLCPYTIIQREFWELIEKYQVTSLSGVPYTYEMLDKLRFQRRKLPCLQTLTQAGGKLSPELHEKFAQYAKENNKNFVVMYGQTEATARMGYLPPEQSLAKIGSMGIAIPGGLFSLVDAKGKTITQPETIGELVYQGKNVALGYAEDGNDLCKEDEFNGRLVTGDMAKFDADGYFYIVGRKKRFLKIFGNRVNLDETERLIKTRFQTLDCACAGIDDAMCIYITDNQKIKEVQKFVAETSNLNFVAFTVKYIEQIPKNEAGKTLYKELDKSA